MKQLSLILFATLLASGQVMFKFAANDINSRLEAGVGRLWVLLSAPLISALIIYAAATLLWVWILIDTPLSKAYPYALLGAAIVPIASVVFFKETLSATYPIGFLLVLLGVYLCVREST